ncbi:PQQ-dependent sugar dehydrogenase [Flindersiella endophytica]
MRLASMLFTVVVLLAGCSGQTTDQPPPGPRTTPEPSPTFSRSPGSSAAPEPAVAGTIASRLTTPWGLLFLPDGTALLSERDTGKVKRVTASGQVSEVGTVPDVEPGGEGGLLGLAFKDNVLYAYFTASDDNRIVKMGYTPSSGGGGGLGEPEVILDGLPSAGNHNGGRMVFGPDGYLYVTAGEAGNPPLAQDLDSLGGKILRITTSGDPAPGNPFDNSPVWSYGHRNPQGLAFDPQGRLWAAEFGQDTWDEINLIEPGKNYGWPEVEGKAGTAGGKYVDPLAVWPTSDASPSGIAYAGGAIWMASLRGARLWRIEVDGEQVVGEPKAYFEGDYGRLRTVVPAPDGSLWLTTSNTDGRGEEYRRPDDDRILRVALS